MKLNSFVSALLFLAGSPCLLAQAAPAAEPAALSGFWNGAIIYSLAENEVDFSFNLSRNQGGDWEGTLTVPLSNIWNRPVQGLSVKGREVSFRLDDGDLKRSFKAALSEDGHRLIGEYQRGDQVAPFELDREPGATTAPEGPTRPEIRLLPGEGNDLKSLFDQDKEHVRLLVLLSPTCSRCQIAARLVQRYVLDRIPDPNVRVYLVWVPAVEIDTLENAKARTYLMPDPRVTQFWTETPSLSEAFKTSLGLQSIAWDVFLLYRPGVTWQSPAPAPQLIMHNRGDLPPDQHLDGIKLSAEVQKMLKSE